MKRKAKMQSGSVGKQNSYEGFGRYNTSAIRRHKTTSDVRGDLQVTTTNHGSLSLGKSKPGTPRGRKENPSKPGDGKKIERPIPKAVSCILRAT